MADDTQDLLRLADEAEKAKGPDRELDRLIHEHVRGKQYRWAEFGGAPAFADQKRIAVEVEPSWLTDEMREWWIDRSEMGAIPAYTVSLDAAETLVPEGDDVTGERYRLEAYSTNGILMPVHVRASAWVPGAPRAYAATAAMALCCAALRARAHSTKENTHVG